MNKTVTKAETLFCLITAFFILLFTSRSSFLFVTNNWDDVNSYFTMGKGMMNGLLIYRDLYDQKGPYLYLLYGLAYLISNRTFLGVFIFEVIAAAASLYCVLKTSAYFCKRKTALMLLPLLAAAIYSSKSFYRGGAAEEYCLPFLFYSLYVLVTISGIEELPDKKVLYKEVFLTGLFAGIIAQIKYTMLGFYMAWAFVAFLFLILNKQKAADIIRFILMFLAAFVLTFIPWLIYFGIKGGLDDWYRCYVYNNIFFYSALEENSSNLGQRLYELAKYLYWLIIDNYAYFCFIIIGFIGLLITKGSIVKRLFAPFIFGCTFFVIFFGGNTLPYYSIPLMSLAGFGLCLLGAFIDLVIKRVSKEDNKRYAFSIATAVILVLSVLFAKNNCLSRDYLHESKEDFFLTQFKEIVEKEDSPTLLNVGGLDAGLYTITGIVPTCEYFQTNGIGLPTMFEEQQKYIDEGRTTFILVCNYAFENMGAHYEMVKEAEYEGQTYYLYQKIK